MSAFSCRAKAAGSGGTSPSRITDSDPMTYALASLAMVAAALLAWRAYGAAVQQERERKEERRREDDR